MNSSARIGARSHRTALAAWVTGVVAMSAVALGCSSDATTKSDSLSGTVEVYSWWTAGGEADGLNALIDTFKTEYPGITFINATAKGGSGTVARELLKQRLAQNQPPDSFQVLGGKDLIVSWVKPAGQADDSQSKMEPLNDLYDSEGWNDKFPPGLIDILSYGGRIYSVPVNVHHANTLFYNVKVFKDANLQPPTTLDEFVTVADAFKAKGIAPIILGAADTWSVTMIFENSLIARGGAAFFRDYFAGNKAADDPLVYKALEDTKKILSYANGDATQLTWDAAAQKVGEGSAAMIFMGDWAKGYFQSKNLTPGTDFEYVPSMGTTGTFLMVTDTFGLPKGAPSRANSLAWLKVVGSVEGQDAFNPKKGSIPARKDADLSKYDAMSVRTVNEFKSSELIPSLAHGCAAAPDYKVAVNDAMVKFLADGNIDAVVGLLKERQSQLK